MTEEYRWSGVFNISVHVKMPPLTLTQSTLAHPYHLPRNFEYLMYVSDLVVGAGCL